MIDGVVVTTTTSKVIYGDEDKQLKDDHVLRYVSIVMSVFKYNLFLLIAISKILWHKISKQSYFTCYVVLLSLHDLMFLFEFGLRSNIFTPILFNLQYKSIIILLAICGSWNYV